MRVRQTQIKASRFSSAREGEQNNTQLAVKFTPLFDLHRTIFWDENKTDQSEAFAAGKTPGTVICKRTLDWTEDYLICEASFHWLGNVGQAKINALPRSHQSVGLKRDRAQTDTVWEEKQRCSSTDQDGSYQGTREEGSRGLGGCSESTQSQEGNAQEERRSEEGKGQEDSSKEGSQEGHQEEVNKLRAFCR